jgi:hypothetical protein
MRIAKQNQELPTEQLLLRVRIGSLRARRAQKVLRRLRLACRVARQLANLDEEMRQPLFPDRAGSLVPEVGGGGDRGAKELPQPSFRVLRSCWKELCRLVEKHAFDDRLLAVA